jgi:hypothetical protein
MVWALSLSTKELIPPGLTPRLDVRGLRSLVGDGTPRRALTQPVLYHHGSPPEARPKTISGRTSYLRV